MILLFEHWPPSGCNISIAYEVVSCMEGNSVPWLISCCVGHCTGGLFFAFPIYRGPKYDDDAHGRARGHCTGGGRPACVHADCHARKWRFAVHTKQPTLCTHGQLAGSSPYMGGLPQGVKADLFLAPARAGAPASASSRLPPSCSHAVAAPSAALKKRSFTSRLQHQGTPRPTAPQTELQLVSSSPLRSGPAPSCKPVCHLNNLHKLAGKPLQGCSRTQCHTPALLAACRRAQQPCLLSHRPSCCRTTCCAIALHPPRHRPSQPSSTCTTQLPLEHRRRSSSTTSPRRRVSRRSTPSLRSSPSAMWCSRPSRTLC